MEKWSGFVYDLLPLVWGFLASEADDLWLSCSVEKFLRLARLRIVATSFLARMLTLALVLYPVMVGSFRRSVLVTLGVLLSRLLSRLRIIGKGEARYAHKH
ncbi:MAG: hypothetical protein LBU15_03355 [Rickettsiales bacterium]|jgi:hypothetical protein|nr:hypothetical protein [Rickettsiales bacterium]